MSEAAGDVEPRWMAAMRRGDLEAAWCETDRLELPRRAAEQAGTLAKPGPFHLLWNGAPFEDRRVVVHCNHGLGDTIQFARFLPQLAQRARSVCVMAQPPLVAVLRTTPDFGEIRNGWEDPLPAYDVVIEIMELAYALRLSAAELAPRIPYFDLASIRRLATKFPISEASALQRIGLVWASSTWDSSRSLPVSELAPLGAFASKFHFYSFQQGAEAERIGELGFHVEPLEKKTADILDAAAALLEMDLVITVDTLIAHLAGALGRPVFLLLQHGADWRWMEGRTDSPWYPTMCLLRQSSPGSWCSVVSEAVERIRLFQNPLS